MPARAAHPAPWSRLAAALACCAAFCAAPAPAQVIMKEVPEEMQGIELESKLGQQAALDTPIVDSTGKTVTLGSYFNQGKPVVLALVYYNCPMICPLTLARLQERLNSVSYTVGADFNVVVVSFNPDNTTQMAAENRETYLAGYNKPMTPVVRAGWTFHTATTGAARAIANSVGFKYRFYPESGEYGHPSVLTVLTSDGRISGYVQGLDPQPNDLRIALLQATQGKIANSVGDFFLHFCYRYDPRSGKYTMQVMRVMQLGGFLTVMGLTTLIVALRAGERARRARAARTAAPAALSGVAGGTT
jgi:protein SCO1/2